METVFQRADQGLSTTAQFIPAGTVQPGMPFNPSTANQCAYGQTYRSSKRGGKYVATVADCPQPSIYVRGHCVLLIDGRFIAHRTDCGCINAVAVWVCRDWVQPCACCVCTAQGSGGGCAGLTRAPSGKSRLNHILCRYLRLLSEVTSGSKIVIRAGFTLFVHRSIGITITIIIIAAHSQRRNLPACTSYVHSSCCRSINSRLQPNAATCGRQLTTPSVQATCLCTFHAPTKTCHQCFANLPARQRHATT